ncbi:MAG: hypothetical protein WB562_13145 [Candidatus Sulfotelmatobacter sp.]
MANQRYVIEGCYINGDDDSSITGDYVMAESEEDAIEIVASVRGAADDWKPHIAETFEEHIVRERERLDRMAAMTPEEVEQGWTDTLANLPWGEDEETEED